MILFLEYSAGGKRGGELFMARFHAVLSRHFEVSPNPLPLRPRKLSNPLRQIPYSLNLAKSFNPEMVVVDVSSGIRNCLAVRWMRRHGRKVLIIVQGKRDNLRLDGAMGIRSLVNKAESYLLRHADIIVTNSYFMAALTKSGLRQNVHIAVARPGIDLVCNRQQPPYENGNSIQLLLVGECIKLKGIEYIIRALPLIIGKDVILRIAGLYNESDRYYRKMTEIVRAERLNENVKFLGFVDKATLHELYAKSDIYVQPSLSEGYGIAMAEALAYGLPIVASRVAAIPEMIEDGINGILVPPKNPLALAEAIQRLIDDRGLRDRMRANNHAKADSLPTWNDFDRILERELVPAIERLTGLKAH